MPNIDQLKALKQYLDEKNAQLIAVSKTKTVKDIREVYDAGQRVFGENRVQEMVEKQGELPNDIEWHLIGHLQTNKVKYMASFVALVHSVDSLKLLEEVNKQAIKHGRVIDCLLQMHIAEESSKFGLNEAELKELLESEAFRLMSNVRIVGLMGMATFTDDEEQLRSEFKHLKGIFDRTKSAYFANRRYFKDISMGMSGDYELAVAEGSTMVRVGSLIFGSR